MKRIILASIASLVLAAGLSAQFAYVIEAPLAREAFRTGVEAYHRGRYAESLLLFERTLADAPKDPLVLYWLGKAYYRMGMLSTALERWSDARLAGGPSPFLESRMELAGAALSPERLVPPQSYAQVQSLPGAVGKDTRFTRPSWVEPRSDGSAWLVAHGTNQILRISPDGRIIERLTGGVSGFDRPFALTVLPDGGMFVTEFQANRVARLDASGTIVGYMGAASGPERLAGPQYICSDSDGFAFLTDVGFARVVKYTSDGRFIQSFGQRTPAFEGLKLPTGIAWHRGMVYVADAALKGIVAFDPYGNYAGTVAMGRLSRPEGLRSTERGLLLADGYRVVLVDPESEAITELYRSDDKRSRLVSAGFDANGDILVADFDRSALDYLADPTVRYTGLSVDVVAVNADAFPRISLDLRVRDRFGRPLVGLSDSAFYVSESVRATERRVEGGKTVDYFFDSIRPALDLRYEGSLDATASSTVCVLLEGSPELSANRTRARDALGEVMGGFGPADAFSLVSALSSPQPAVMGGLKDLSAAVLAMRGEGAWRFDSGLRLAAGSLFQAPGRRAVVYLSTGSANEATMDGVSVAELADLLSANGIVFSAVILGNGSVSPVLEYLAQSSGGTILRSDRPQGLSEIAAIVRAAPMGLYRLSYTAQAPDGFGLSYLPFSVEVYLRDRSGKDESGYFAPLR